MQAERFKALGVTASQSLPDGRYVVSAAWRCGGTSGKLQAADGVKASVSLCAILCGIVPSFPTPNVMKSQGISQIHPKRSEKPQPELQPQEIMKRQKIVKLNCSEAKPSVGHENGARIQNRNSFTLLEALFKKFCKRDFCDEVRDFKIPEPEAVAS